MDGGGEVDRKSEDIEDAERITVLQSRRRKGMSALMMSSAE